MTVTGVEHTQNIINRTGSEWREERIEGEAVMHELFDIWCDTIRGHVSYSSHRSNLGADPSTACLAAKFLTVHEMLEHPLGTLAAMQQASGLPLSC